MANIYSLKFALVGVFAIYSVNAVHIAIDCIPLIKCPQLLNLVETNRNSLETIRLLKTSHCGYHGKHPKVWCTQVSTECKTPNGKLGHCMDLSQCPLLQKLITSENELNDVQTYIENSKCKGIRPESDLICCPPDDEIQIPTTEIITSTIPTDIIPPSTEVIPNLDNQECGHQLTSKIFGGKETDMDEFPWTALLQYQWKSEFSTNCAGSLINARYVVTAAHCVDNSAIRSVGNLVNVILGEYDTRNETDCINIFGITSCADPPLIVPVDAIIVHPEWYRKPPATINHDIALVRLITDVKFTDYIRPICLPTSKTVLSRSVQFFVTGWGHTELGNTSPVKLKTTLPLANRAECVQKYKTDKRLNVGDGQFCVGGEEGKDSCSGDSGGPLMYTSENNGVTWFLAGVVSFGPNQPCGIKDYPGLYTYLPNYINWIHETIQT